MLFQRTFESREERGTHIWIAQSTSKIPNLRTVAPLASADGKSMPGQRGTILRIFCPNSSSDEIAHYVVQDSAFVPDSTLGGKEIIFAPGRT
jgi:hypothetical protein